MSSRSAALFIASLTLGTVSGCSSKDDKTLATEIAQGIIAACPSASPSDPEARVQCAAKLVALAPFRDALREGVLWGGQKAGRGYRLDASTTRFNALVWRKMYVSLFMFDGAFSIEQAGDQTVIHLPFHFRNELDIGSYPYPFWHSKTKWDSWQYSKELLLVMDKGQIVGALRSSDFDMTRKYVNRNWDGLWQWTEAGQIMPFVSLYSYLLSPENPHKQALDDAYRALEAEMRPQLCTMCHAPDNKANADQLEFFNFPNQALYSRHNIVAQLEQNKMPPQNDLGVTPGIADESTRQKLIALAKAFEAAGDAALDYEGENKAQYVPPPDMSAAP